MRRSAAAIHLAAFAAFSIPPNTLMAGPILPSLAPGSEYQLIFVTSDLTDGTFSTEDPYNELVNTNAASINSLLASAGIHGVSWSAITSTADGTAAKTNAPWGGVPVFNLNCTQINLPGESLYVGAILNPVLFDDGGLIPPYTLQVWTGSNETGIPSFPLGNPLPIGLPLGSFGDSSSTDSDWLFEGPQSLVYGFHVYGLSSVITIPTPEPATVSLLETGIVLLSGMRLLRRRRRACQ
jgi:hypothetical protein